MPLGFTTHRASTSTAFDYLLSNVDMPSQSGNAIPLFLLAKWGNLTQVKTMYLSHLTRWYNICENEQVEKKLKNTLFEFVLIWNIIYALVQTVSYDRSELRRSKYMLLPELYVKCTFTCQNWISFGISYEYEPNIMWMSPAERTAWII